MRKNLIRKFFVDIGYVTLIYSKWAKRYPIHYISVPILLPVGTFVAFAFTVSPENRMYAVSGPIVFAISLTTILYIAQWVGADKMLSRLSLFATLPVSPFAYGLGVALSAAINCLISISSVLLLASAFFGLALTWNWILLIPTFLISFAAGAAIGLLIAWSSKDPRAIGATAQLVSFAFTLFAPVFYPLQLIPFPLNLVAMLIPTTYSAMLVRDSLIGDTSAYLHHFAPLLIITVVLLILAQRKVRWRQR